MQNIKNFTQYEPPKELRAADMKATGRVYDYYISEEGHDWYECQELFRDDTVKLMYNSSDVICAVVDKPIPWRGNTFSVSVLIPDGMSVAEISQADYPADCRADGTWKFNGERVYRDTDIVESRTYQHNKRTRDRLLMQAAAYIATLHACNDSDSLSALQQCLRDLRSIDLTQPDPAWPTIPEL